MYFCLVRDTTLQLIWRVWRNHKIFHSEY